MPDKWPMSGSNNWLCTTGIFSSTFACHHRYYANTLFDLHFPSHQTEHPPPPYTWPGVQGGSGVDLGFIKGGGGGGG